MSNRVSELVEVLVSNGSSLVKLSKILEQSQTDLTRGMSNGVN